jgi:hypothetical protein
MNGTLIFILVVSSFSGMAQTFYSETETRMEGVPAMFAKVGEFKIRSYFTREKTIIITQSQAGKTTMLFRNDSALFVNGKECYADSKANIAAVNDKQMQYEDIQIEKHNDVRTILNYPCETATIRFKVKNGVFTTSQSMLVYYTTHLQDSAFKLSSFADHETVLTKAMMELKGTVLLTELSSGSIKTFSEVKKLENVPFSSEYFKLDNKKCKKMMTYKEYSDKMSRQNTTSPHFNSFSR